MPLVERRQGRRAYFRVSGTDVEPPEWTRYAPPYQEIRPPTARQRKRYYQILASELWHQKQKELEQGLDARGQPLAPVKKPRKGTSDWHLRKYRRGTGPPLMPFRIDSRTRNLLRFRSNEREAVVYWAAKPAPGSVYTWPEILVFHAEGRVRGAPARNVIGLSPKGLATAVEQAVKRYRIKSGPRKVTLPTTTRWDATKRQARRPEAGGDPFDVRFRRVGVLERAGQTIMRLFRRQPPPLPQDAEQIPRIVPVGQTLLFRLGNRWLIVRGRRSWVVSAGGTVSRRPLSAYEGQARSRIDPYDPRVPQAVRELWERINGGGEPRAFSPQRSAAAEPAGSNRLSAQGGQTGRLDDPVTFSTWDPEEVDPALDRYAAQRGDQFRSEFLRKAESHQKRSADWEATNTALLREWETIDKNDRTAALAFKDRFVAHQNQKPESSIDSLRNLLIETVGLPPDQQLKIRTQSKLKARGKFTTIDAMDEEQAGKHQSAIEFVQRLTSNEHGELSVGFGQFASKAKKRAYADSDSDGGYVYTDRMDDVSTIVHELGHVLEFKLPGIYKAADGYRKAKTRDTPTLRMSEISQQGGYGSDEVGNEDDWFKTWQDRGLAAYVGKVYPNATEVVAMGVEKLHRDPVGFARSDPKFFDLVVGMMRGEIKGQ